MSTEETKANDESTREVPGFGDESLTRGPVVEAQLAEMESLGGASSSEKSTDSDAEEAFKAAADDGTQKEGAEEKTESPETEQKDVEEVEEQETPEVESSEEEEETDEGEEDAEEAEEPEEEPEEELSQVKVLQARNDKLMELLNNSGLLTEEFEEPEEPEPEPVVAPKKEFVPSAKLPEVSQEELDNIVSDPAAFNTHMKSVFEAGQQVVFSMMPRVISSHMETQRDVDNFFQKNDDLTSMSSVVMQIAQGIQAKNPTMTAKPALEAAGKRLRATLGLVPKEVVEKAKNKKRGPRFAPGTSRRTKAVESSKPKAKKKKADSSSFDSQYDEIDKLSLKR